MTFFTVAAVYLVSSVSFPKTPLVPAVKEARETGRLVLAEFWTFNTQISRSYSEQVLSDRLVLDWLREHAVGARVNVDFNRKLRERFFIREVPTVLLLDPSLRVWARLEGAKRPAEIVKGLNGALKIRRKFLEAQKILQKNPEDVKALLALFQGYLAQENSKEAERVLKRLRKIDPECKSVPCGELAFEIASHIYEPRKNVEAAIRLYREAATWARSKKPELRRDALFRIANLKLYQKEFETAAKVLQLLLKESGRFPERSKAMYTLGLIYVRHLKDFKRGKEVLEKVRDSYADRFALAAEKLLQFMSQEAQ